MSKRPLATIGAITLTLAVLAGCNTLQGIGKDVKQGGEAIERAAKK